MPFDSCKAKDRVLFYGTGQGFDTARPKRIPMQYEGVAYKDPRWIHLADLNNDGREDLVVANGYITGPDLKDL